MKKILSQKFLMPFFGYFIRICFALKFLQPIVWLTAYFCESWPGSQKTPAGNKKTRILALNHARFRGELDVLSKTGEFEIIILPYFWMCRLLYAFFRTPATLESVLTPTDAEKPHHERLAKFMDVFLPKLYDKMPVDIVLINAVHYKSDYLWGEHSSRNGVSFVVIHRESFMASPYLQKQKTDVWKKLGSDYAADLIITQTPAARDIFVNAGMIEADKIVSAGTMRMDQFVEKYHGRSVPRPDKKQVTLFSFTYAVGVGHPIPHWYEEGESHDGFAGMFEQTHTAFAQFAKDNPEVHCVMKPKWGGVWAGKIDAALAKNGLDRETIPNLEILIDVNVHDLIEQSNVICGYGSTTLLETIVIGNRPIIVPILGELQEERNNHKIMLGSNLDLFDTVYSKDDFMKKIGEHVSSDAPIPDDLQEKREALFQKWSSPLDEKATSLYTNLLKNTVSRKKGEK